VIQSVLTFRSAGNSPHQEDDLLCNEDRGIFVVADGFGGLDAGPDASRVTCESVKGFLEKEAGDLDATLPFVIRQYFSLAGNVLFNALVHANRKVMSLNKGKNMNERGGAAAVAAFLDGDFLALANAGNCSASLFRGGKRVELVKPRCYSTLLEPFGGSQSRAPLMALGIFSDLEPEIVEVRVKEGDFLLLHTDGLSVSQLDEISGVLSGIASGMTADSVFKNYFESQSFSENVAVVGVQF
jgi:protein phosphatase